MIYFLLVDNLVWSDWVSVVVLWLYGACWVVCREPQDQLAEGTLLWLQLLAGQGCVMVCLGVTSFEITVKFDCSFLHFQYVGGLEFCSTGTVWCLSLDMQDVLTELCVERLYYCFVPFVKSII